MSAKLDILRSIAKRAKSMQAESIPANSVQDDVLLSDALYKEVLLQLEKRNLIKVETVDKNWYRNFAEAGPSLLLRLTNLGKQQVQNNIR